MVLRIIGGQIGQGRMAQVDLALVAMAPLIAIQVMGIVYTRKTKATKVVEDNLNDDIVVELEEE